MDGIRNRSFYPGYVDEYKCTAIGLCVLLRVQKNTCRGSYCNVDGIGNRSFLPGYLGEYKCTAISLCVILRVQPKRINAEVRTATWTGVDAVVSVHCKPPHPQPAIGKNLR